MREEEQISRPFCELTLQRIQGPQGPWTSIFFGPLSILGHQRVCVQKLSLLHTACACVRACLCCVCVSAHMLHKCVCGVRVCMCVRVSSCVCVRASFCT